MQGLGIETNCSRIAQKLIMARQQSNGELLHGSLATGSFWLDDGAWYLITNWHNITGCNPVTGAAMSKTGFLPTHVIVHLLYSDMVEGRERLRWNGKLAPLYDDHGVPLWFEHPTYRNAVDVVALKLGMQSAEDADIFSLPINKHPNWFDLSLVPGGDCFVLGYPKGVDAGFHLPLWKRASIASEPSLDHAGLPRLLIDTATRLGMSGAPVVAVSNGWNVPRGGGIGDAVFGRVETFVGVTPGAWMMTRWASKSA